MWFYNLILQQFITGGFDTRLLVYVSDQFFECIYSVYTFNIYNMIVFKHDTNKKNNKMLKIGLAGSFEKQ
jgi:hypothetical protein